MKATINLQLSYEEAYSLAKYLPKGEDYDDKTEQEMARIRVALCEVMGIDYLKM